MDVASSPFPVFDALLSGLRDPYLARLYDLSAWGRWGPWAGDWVRAFRELGVLHLLVLSGSQVSYLRASSERLLGWAIRTPFGRGVTASRLLRVSSAAVLLAYAHLAGWPPPLARAVLLGLWDLAKPEWRGGVKLAAALACQVALFPSSCGELSFLLSWTCFLWLQMSRALSSSVARAVFVASLCPAWSAWILNDAPSGAGEVVRLILANALLGVVFEKLVMPLSGWLLAISLLVPSVAFAQGIATFLAPVLAGAGSAVLVGLEAFRYSLEP